MTGDQTYSDTSQDLESVIANDDLLDILRGGTEFSLDQYSGLDIVLEKLRIGLAEFVSGFISEEVNFELSNVAIYEDEEQFSTLGAKPGFVNFHDKKGELVLCVGLGSASFRRILKNLLGSPRDDATSNFSPSLTSAENKLFQRFSNRLCRAYAKTLELKFNEYDAVETDFKILNKLSSEQELIVLTYRVSFSEASFKISLLTTLDQLEPIYLGQQDKEVSANGTTQPGSWAQKLTAKIDELEVPIYAHLVEKTMNLVDVAKFEKGTRLDIEFELNDVCVADAEENSLFAADMEIQESEIVFRVTGSPANS